MAPLVWLITGCSTGFGRELAVQILSRGDKVIATARDVSKLAALKAAGADTLALDVTADPDTIKQVTETAHRMYGKIDIFINNAGILMDGAVEETSPEEAFAIFNTNVFGPINMIRAVAPYMRAQRSGVIANVSSVGAWMAGPGCGLYCASKWAISGVSESVAGELESFGISVTCIEPGYFRSNLLNAGHRNRAQNLIADYEGTASRQMMDGLDAVNNKQPGDIAKGAGVIIDVLSQTGAAAGRPIPLRLVLGGDANIAVRQKCESTLALLDGWRGITTTTDHDDV